MGCSNIKADHSIPAITKKQSVHEIHLMNPHMEDFEAEVLHPGRIDKKKLSLGLEPSTRLPVNNSKISLTEIKPLSNPNLPDSQLLDDSDKTLNLTLNLSIIKPPEKVSFPNHEHRFDFDFLLHEPVNDDHSDNQLVDDILKELNN